jgi:hypothetical protein
VKGGSAETQTAVVAKVEITDKKKYTVHSVQDLACGGRLLYHPKEKEEDLKNNTVDQHHHSIPERGDS